MSKQELLAQDEHGAAKAESESEAPMNVQHEIEEKFAQFMTSTSNASPIEHAIAEVMTPGHVSQVIDLSK